MHFPTLAKFMFSWTLIFSQIHTSTFRKAVGVIFASSIVTIGLIPGADFENYYRNYQALSEGASYTQVLKQYDRGLEPVFPGILWLVSNLSTSLDLAQLTMITAAPTSLLIFWGTQRYSENIRSDSGLAMSTLLILLSPTLLEHLARQGLAIGLLCAGYAISNPRCKGSLFALSVLTHISTLFALIAIRCSQLTRIWVMLLGGLVLVVMGGIENWMQILGRVTSKAAIYIDGSSFDDNNLDEMGLLFLFLLVVLQVMGAIALRIQRSDRLRGCRGAINLKLAMLVLLGMFVTLPFTFIPIRLFAFFSMVLVAWLISDLWTTNGLRRFAPISLAITSVLVFTARL